MTYKPLRRGFRRAFAGKGRLGAPFVDLCSAPSKEGDLMLSPLRASRSYTSSRRPSATGTCLQARRGQRTSSFSRRSFSSASSSSCTTHIPHAAPHQPLSSAGHGERPPSACSSATSSSRSPSSASAAALRAGTSPTRRGGKSSRPDGSVCRDASRLSGARTGMGASTAGSTTGRPS